MKNRVRIAVSALIALLALGLWLMKADNDRHVLDRDGMVNVGYVHISQ